MGKISVVIITQNNIETIGKVLESVKWADEIVVVDSFSTDGTREICEKYTNKIFERRYEGYACDQKNYGIDQATSDWILSLDSDEVVSPKLAEELQQAADDPTYDGYRFLRRNFFLGHWLQYSTGPNLVLRFFRQGKGWVNDREVHEEIVVNGHVGTLSGHLDHYSILSLAAFVDRLNKYSTLEAERCYRQGTRFRCWKSLLEPIRIFVWFYLRKQGFRDGWHGFLWAAITAFEVFLIWIKQWEQEKGIAKVDDKKLWW